MGLPDVRRKASFIRPTRKPSRDEILAGLGRFAVAELGEDLQNTVQMRQTRSESVDELVEHELALFKSPITVANFLGQIVQELRLNSTERLGGGTTRTGQIGIRVLPLLQFGRSLLIDSIVLLNQPLEQLVLLLLTCDQVP